MTGSGISGMIDFTSNDNRFGWLSVTTLRRKLFISLFFPQQRVQYSQSLFSRLFCSLSRLFASVDMTANFSGIQGKNCSHLTIQI